MGKLGTISAAAIRLSVHRATVHRHVDTLEAELGVKLFHRHARGYTPTEAGMDMIATAERIESLCSGLQGRTQGSASPLSGKLVVTAVSAVACTVMPVLVQYRQQNPGVELCYVADERLARLEYGEAHVALRAGPKPEGPDYVVMPYPPIEFCLYAHADYLSRHGLSDQPEQACQQQSLRSHCFIGSLDADYRAPFVPWLQQHVSADQIALKTRNHEVVLQGVMQGLGLGFLSIDQAKQHPNLKMVWREPEILSAQIWIVTHVALHRTEKVQRLVRLLKSEGLR